MRGLVEKFGEKLVNEALDIFEEILENVEDQSAQVGVCRVLMNMASAASYRLISTISARLMGIMDNNIASNSPEIREYAVDVFVILFRRQSENLFIQAQLEKTILYKLGGFIKAGKEDFASQLLASLSLMLTKAPDLTLQDRLLTICKVTT